MLYSLFRVEVAGECHLLVAERALATGDFGVVAATTRMLIRAGHKEAWKVCLALAESSACAELESRRDAAMFAVANAPPGAELERALAAWSSLDTALEAATVGAVPVYIYI